MRVLTWVPSKPQLPLLIASGYVLRWLVLPLTAHYDALFMPWQASIVLHGQPNVYEALYRVFGETSISPTPWAANMPGYNFLTAGWLWLMRGLGLLTFVDWGALATKAAGAATAREVARGLVLGSFEHPSSALFLLKLPYFFIDIAVGWMLYRLGGRSDEDMAAAPGADCRPASRRGTHRPRCATWARRVLCVLPGACAFRRQ